MCEVEFSYPHDDRAEDYVRTCMRCGAMVSDKSHWVDGEPVWGTDLHRAWHESLSKVLVSALKERIADRLATEE